MTRPVSSDTAPSAPTKLDPHVVRIAMAVIAGGIAVIFDATIVSIALRQLTEDLHASLGTIQWVSTAYLLAMFVAIPPSSWLQSRLGGKRLWILALGVFLLGSVLCALAWDAPSLIAFRVVQGLGGGVMMPLMMTLIMQAARGQSMGRLMALIGLPASLGPIVGPVIGGIILHWLDWPWLFLVNVPFCVVGAWLAWRILPDDRPAPGPRPSLDVGGLLLIVPGLVGVIFGLSNVSKNGGFGRGDVWAPVVIGVILTALFVGWGLRRGSRALLDVRLFTHRPLAVGSFLLAVMAIALYGAMLLLPLYFQQLRGQGALGAGLLLIPQGVGALLSRTLGGRLTDDIGPRPVSVLGFVILAAATVPFALAGTDTATWWLMVVLLIRGVGLGLVMTPIMTVSFVGIAPQQMPDASIITRVAQQVGGSFGTAVLAVVLESAARGGGSATSGFHQAFWWATGLTLLGAALSFLLPGRTRQPDRSPSG
ncbi:MDR family MFS transporter [Williamsia sterculiae]|uniref:Drug resistance transporter, EmrB/QacA subfamily n=1 Tax=Williamsia sterculiae TaxID=1344003 RepID=A0A1N7H7B5_9NOCA|nr:MDR family MFS transporter [Williamsia sterculiae]SIS20691.1 drug resistance transporter, EmrB/QacA subfamily [Williamsia sterculiae]